MFGIDFDLCAVSTGGASVVAKLIGDRQRLWGDATQKRISNTGSMLRDMSTLKMTGLTEVMGNIVQGERIQETKRMEAWSWIKVWQNVICNIPFAIAPAATFGAYAIQASVTGSQSLNTVQAFTSLALVTLVSYPATRLLAAVPNLAASIGSFDRIQDFLLSEQRDDRRTCFLVEETEQTLIDLQPETPKATDQWMIRLQNVSIKPAPEATFTLDHISMRIEKGRVVMLTGPVGAGKTTLLKAIMGECPCEDGSISIGSKHVAFCAQTPWLQSDTVRQSICGFEHSEHIDRVWYDTVLEGKQITSFFLALLLR